MSWNQLRSSRGHDQPRTSSHRPAPGGMLSAITPVERLMADTSTFAEDATRHWHSLPSTAFRKTGKRHDAEDLVQETYLRACRCFEGFREGTDIAAWLQRIRAPRGLATHVEEGDPVSGRAARHEEESP